MLKIKGGSRELEVDIASLAGQDLLTVLRGGNFDVPAACGGKGKCGKCKVRIKRENTGEIWEANACQVYTYELDGDYTVRLLRSEELFAGETSFLGADGYDGEIGAELGFAIDIGTTTIALCIVDLANGHIKDSYSTINRQRRFGADVISRIEASKDHLGELNALVTEDLVTGMRTLLDRHSVEPDRIRRMVIAGNTCMISLLLNIDCHMMGMAPFAPPAQLTKLQEYAFRDIFGEDAGIDCKVAIPPCVSAFVGSDITAGMLLMSEYKYETNSLLFDMGTNGEIALFSGGEVICASAAAGPALEGGNISCGTGGIPGAVYTVTQRDGVFEYKTIDDMPPVGICGSAVIDIVSCLLEMCYADETGLLDDDYFDDGVTVCDNVVFTQADLRSVQLSKSAIRAGIECVIEAAGITDDDIDALYIAGGFGVKIGVKSAVNIGLIPMSMVGRLVPLGNSSLGGAVKMLCHEECAEEIEKFISRSRELELSGNSKFNDAFMEYIGF